MLPYCYLLVFGHLPFCSQSCILRAGGNVGGLHDLSIVLLVTIVRVGAVLDVSVLILLNDPFVSPFVNLIGGLDSLRTHRYRNKINISDNCIFGVANKQWVQKSTLTIMPLKTPAYRNCSPPFHVHCSARTLLYHSVLHSTYLLSGGGRYKRTLTFCLKSTFCLRFHFCQFLR